jgi:hypothetical protein
MRIFKIRKGEENSMKLGWMMALGALAAVQSCAHSNLDRKIDSEIAQESSIKTHADLRKEASQLIESAADLTDEQRKQLLALRDSMRTQLDALGVQSLKLRSILIKDLLATRYDEDEVELIEHRMKDVEEKSLSVTLKAIEEANKILGHQAVANRQLVERFWDYRGSRE